jgi:hypothetical protein
MYNTKIVCSYHLDSVFEDSDNISDDDKDFVRNVIYRQEFCDIFGMDEFDEKLALETIENIYNKIKAHPRFSECLERSAKYYPCSIIDESMSLMCLFSFTYLYLTHNCIIEFLEKNEISDESISKLLEELDKQNN